MDSSVRTTFKARLWQATEEGMLWGVKLTIAAAILLLGMSYLVGDYNVVRERAMNGQQAFEYLQTAQRKAHAEGANDGNPQLQER